MSLAGWLETRTGIGAAVRTWLSTPVARTRSRPVAAAIGALLLVEALSGLSLALSYSPSTTHAWPSTWFVQRVLALGWLTRGLHAAAASLLVALAVLYIFVGLLDRAYRAPRELVWIASLLLVGLLVVASHSGVLLPGDQAAFWRTEELFTIIGGVPYVGSGLVALVRGGPRYGHLTLTRLYAAHALLIPAAILALGWARARWWRRAAMIEKAPLTHGMTRDALAVIAALVACLAIALVRHGAPLAAPADVSVPYPARPEWYFLPIFELRRSLGAHDWLATLALPALAFLFLAALPWLDGGRRDPRAPVFAAAVFIVLASGGLALRSRLRDARDPKFQALVVSAARDAADADRLAPLGIPSAGPSQLYRKDPVVFGRRVFAQHCETCHESCSDAPNEGSPCLEGYRSRAWLRAFLRDPKSDRFFANATIDEMDPYRGDDASLSALVEFLYAQGGGEADAGLVAKGRALFSSEGCEGCHSLSGESGEGPDLGGYGSPAWLSAFIRAPRSERFYGKDGEMEVFGPDRLSDPELAAVVAYVRAREQEPLKYSSLGPSKGGRVAPSKETHP